MAAGVPLLATPGLGVADNSVDANALSFLTHQNLLTQEKKEKEERQEAKKEKVRLEKQLEEEDPIRLVHPLRC